MYLAELPEQIPKSVPAETIGLPTVRSKYTAFFDRLRRVFLVNTTYDAFRIFWVRSPTPWQPVNGRSGGSVDLTMLTHNPPVWSPPRPPLSYEGTAANSAANCMMPWARWPLRQSRAA